jgi:hypothetical protein
MPIENPTGFGIERTKTGVRRHGQQNDHHTFADD